MIDFLSEFLSIRWILIITTVALFIYHSILKTWNFFGKQNVKCVRGLPLIGTQYRSLLQFESTVTDLDKLYYTHPNEQIIGFYGWFGIPSYLLRDAELIKKIANTDFEHFMNRSFKIDQDSDPLFGGTLFIMRDQQWKHMRATLSPAFTGRRMRLMFALLLNICDNMCEHLKMKCTNGEANDLDVKDLMTRVANDAIASTAFGLDIDSLNDVNNEFYKAGCIITSFEGLAGIKFIGYALIPRIMNFFKVKVFDEKNTKYFAQIVKNNIEYREKHNIVRNDMIQLLIEAQKGNLAEDDEPVENVVGFETISKPKNVDVVKKQKWTDNEILAQCLIFFFAGFNSVSMTLCYAIHELTVHPDIQERLHREIVANEEILNGKPATFEIIQKLKYLEMVVLETLRRWSVGVAIDRVVTKPYTLELNDGRKVTFNVGDSVWLPMHCLQTNAEYFLNPKQFNPERFSDENRDNIVSGSFIPFGSGPRGCIASRFAVMELKVVIYQLVKHFQLEMSSKTQHPIQLKKTMSGLDAEKGFFTKFTMRK